MRSVHPIGMKETFRVIAVLLVLLVLLSLLVDPFFPFHAYWSFTIPLCLVVAWTLEGLTSGKKVNSRVSIVTAGVLLVLSMRYWDFNSRKPFLRNFNGLSKGDTKAEVIERMKSFDFGQGRGFVFGRMRDQHPELNEKVEYMCFTHTHEGWGDSDWGLVYFVDGRLYDTQFSHD